MFHKLQTLTLTLFFQPRWSVTVKKDFFSEKREQSSISIIFKFKKCCMYNFASEKTSAIFFLVSEKRQKATLEATNENIFGRFCDEAKKNCNLFSHLGSQPFDLAFFGNFLQNIYPIIISRNQQK